MYYIEAQVDGASWGAEFGIIVLALTYSYSPPGYTSKGKPEPAEVQLVDATVINAPPDLELNRDDVLAMAENWLQGDGYYLACERAEENYDGGLP